MRFWRSCPSTSTHVLCPSCARTCTPDRPAAMQSSANHDFKTKDPALYRGPLKHNAFATALAVDSAGQVYVTGQADENYATLKYDAGGNPLWVARYVGPGSSGDSAQALAVDGSGNVYVTGSSGGSGTG